MEGNNLFSTHYLYSQIVQYEYLRWIIWKRERLDK